MDPVPGPSGEYRLYTGAAWPPSFTEDVRVKAPNVVGVANKTELWSTV